MATDAAVPDDIPDLGDPGSLWERAGIVTVLLLLLFPAYLLTNHATAGRETITLFTPLDRAISLDANWEFLYAFVYVFVLPGFVVRPRHLFIRCCVSYLFLYLFAVPIFLLMPVTLPRPELVVDSFASWGLALNWFLDPPRNCFPRCTSPPPTWPPSVPGGWTG